MRLKKILYRPLFSLPLLSLLRVAWYKCRGKDIYVKGKCNGCGRCCKGIHLRYKKGWVRTEKEFVDLLEAIPEYNRFAPHDNQEDNYLLFDCSLYDQELGCLDYDNRLDICRKYPSKYLFLHGGSLQEGCGYSLRVSKPFSKYLNHAMSKKRNK